MEESSAALITFWSGAVDWRRGRRRYAGEVGGGGVVDGVAEVGLRHRRRAGAPHEHVQLLVGVGVGAPELLLPSIAKCR